MEYSIGLFGVLCIVCGMLYYKDRGGGGGEDGSGGSGLHGLQQRYLVVYVLMTGSDWLQGAYTYAIYDYFGLTQSDIARLYILDYMAAILFSLFIGSLADK